jgi:predicted RNase H-like HicB family nuclease
MAISKKNSRKPTINQSYKKSSKRRSKKRSNPRFQMDGNACIINFKSVTECVSARNTPADIETMANNCNVDPSIKTKKDRCTELLKIKKTQKEEEPNAKNEEPKAKVIKKDCTVNFKSITECVSARNTPADIETMANNCNVDPSIKTKKDRCTELLKIKKTQKEEESKDEEPKVIKKDEEPKAKVIKKDCTVNFKSITECVSARNTPADIETMANNCNVDPSIKTKKDRCTELLKIKKTQKEEPKEKSVKSKKPSEKSKEKTQEKIKRKVKELKNVLTELEKQIGDIITDYLNNYIFVSGKNVRNGGNYIMKEVESVIKRIASKEDLSDSESWTKDTLTSFIGKYSDIFIDYPITPKKEEQKTPVKEKTIGLSQVDSKLYELDNSKTINDFAALQSSIVRCLRGV